MISFLLSTKEDTRLKRCPAGGTASSSNVWLRRNEVKIGARRVFRICGICHDLAVESFRAYQELPAPSTIKEAAGQTCSGLEQALMGGMRFLAPELVIGRDDGQVGEHQPAVIRGAEADLQSSEIELGEALQRRLYALTGGFAAGAA